MSAKDLDRLKVAAADREAAEFELDHTILNLQEAVAAALRHGEAPEVIAEAIELSPTEVLEMLDGPEGEDANATYPLTGLDPDRASGTLPA